MAFRVCRESRPNTVGRDSTIWVLEDDVGGRLDVWPAMGFNAYRWQRRGQEILYCDANFFHEVRPTRSGFPILFPFPNRIREGRFTWDGTTYQLPTNDRAGKNAIHGFAATRPWRVVEQGAEDGQAWLSAEFQGSRDAADAAPLWPGDYRLRITYRLTPNCLRLEAVVDNPGARPLPFGLGCHPYLCVAPFGGDRAQIAIEARRQWELEECLPTGQLVEAAAYEKSYADLDLDHLWTDVPRVDGDARRCGEIRSASGDTWLVAQASRDFRELVLFTPPHRQAICFEPYTCATDAINLQQRGIDAGLQVLAPQGRWQGWIQFQFVD